MHFVFLQAAQQLDLATGHFNYLKSEILASEELQQNFDSLNIGT